MEVFRVNIKFKNKEAYNALSKRIAQVEHLSSFEGYTLKGTPADGEVCILINRSESATDAIALVLLFTNNLHRGCSVISFRVE